MEIEKEYSLTVPWPVEKGASTFLKLTQLETGGIVWIGRESAASLIKVLAEHFDILV